MDGTGRLVDGTHVEAWANIRQEIEDGAIGGANWSKHEGSFYGSKVYLIVDAVTDLPVAATTATDRWYHSAAFVPLLEEFEARYDVDGLEAVFGDAGFDTQANRGECEDLVEVPL